MIYLGVQFIWTCLHSYILGLVTTKLDIRVKDIGQRKLISIYHHHPFPHRSWTPRQLTRHQRRQDQCKDHKEIISIRSLSQRSRSERIDHVVTRISQKPGMVADLQLVLRAGAATKVYCLAVANTPPWRWGGTTRSSRSSGVLGYLLCTP